MKVNKTVAAKMVGLGRTAFHRHLKDKKISADAEGLIDISELIRVYGNENVKSLEQRELEQRERAAKTGGEHGGTPESPAILDELSRLRSALENSAIEREILSSERRRERDQLNDQIENLRESLKKSMDQNNSLTRLLTDERTREEKRALQKTTEQEKQLEEVLKTVRALENRQNSGWWPFGKRAHNAPQRSA